MDSPESRLSRQRNPRMCLVVFSEIAAVAGRAAASIHGACLPEPRLNTHLSVGSADADGVIGMPRAGHTGRARKYAFNLLLNSIISGL